MKILIAVDFGLYGQAQIKFLQEFSAPENSEFKIVHILEPLLAFSGDYALTMNMPVNIDVLDERRRAAKMLVSDVAEKLNEKYPGKLSHEVREGNPADEILSIADEWGAELILVGSHGKSGLDRFLLGSISSKVSQHANCGVLIAKRPK